MKPFPARILRKQDDLPCYIVIPPGMIDATSAFEARVRLNDSQPFARNIRPWRKGSDVFFFNLTQAQLKSAALSCGDECVVTIEPD